MSTTSRRPVAFIFIAAATVLVLGLSTAPAAADPQVRAVKDAWISMKIHTQYLGEDVLEGSNIDVDTDGGTVILSGTVPTEAARARAIAVAKATDGAKAVTDKLRIGPR